MSLLHCYEESGWSPGPWISEPQSRHLRLHRHGNRGRRNLNRGHSRLILTILLHAAQDHALGSHSLPQLGVGEGLELLVVPLASRDRAALGVDEHGVVLGAEEVRHGVAVLLGVEGHDTVDAGLHLHARGEAQGVADVHERAVLLGLDETHLAGTAGAGRTDLQAPLLGEEQRQGGDVGVLLVAHPVGVAELLLGQVVHHGELLWGGGCQH